MCQFLLITVACYPTRTFKVIHTNNVNTKIEVFSSKHFLLMPVEDNARECRINVIYDGKIVDYLDVRLAQNKIDYFVPLDINKYGRKGVTLEVNNCSFEDLCWQHFSLSDKFKYDYNEKYRPEFHFSPPFSWTNDPNGLVWFNNTWHLFYQFNPYGTKWGNMTWGHAISKDLCNWEYLQPAIFPDDLGTIFSGSCVVDKKNTAGFGENAIIAIYTSAGKSQTECIAYSNDEGKTFKKFSGNPVLTSNVKDFRDPKVFWDIQTSKWIMSLAVGHNIEFYSSTNLKDWKFESRFGENYGAHGGIWECPDLIKLPVEGTENIYKWVLLVNLNPGGLGGGSATQYFVGDFDGHRFTPFYDKDKTLWMDYGKDHYATVTWNNAPDDRKIALAWMNNWQYANELPTNYFRGYMSLPRELSLVISSEGEYILASKPIKEIDEFKKPTYYNENITITTEYKLQLPEETIGGCYELDFSIDSMSMKNVIMRLLNMHGEFVDLSINPKDRYLTIDRSTSGNVMFNEQFASVVKGPLSDDKKYSFRIIVDKSSIECFVNNGKLAMTNLVFPTEPYNRITFYSEGEAITLKGLTIFNLEKRQQK